MQLKAAFLLIVFHLNMVIGFACNLGLDMFCNKCNQEKTELMTSECCHHKAREAVSPRKQKSCTGICCNEHIIKFSKVDKSFPQGISYLNTIFFTSLISSFYYIDVLQTYKSSANINYFVQDNHPPIPDIRIAIQSFQI